MTVYPQGYAIPLATVIGLPPVSLMLRKSAHPCSGTRCRVYACEMRMAFR